MAISSVNFDIISAIRESNISHPELRGIQERINLDQTSCPGFSFKNGLLLYNDRLVIPSDSPLRWELLTEFHSSPTGGHAGITRTFHRLSSNFFWQAMRKDVKKFVKECQTCQQMKTTNLHPQGLLQPLPLPNAVFEGISMDFVVGLPTSKGKTVIMVIVDRLSKYRHLVGLPTQFSSVMVAAAFIQEVVRLHGIPKEIVTDRDVRFMSEFWRELHRLQGTTLNMSTAHHPQSNGQTEALNKCLEMYLRCYVADNPTSWMLMLPWAEFWYNTAFQTAAKMTPFEILYGRPPPTIPRYVQDSSNNSLVDIQLRERDKTLSLLRANLTNAQARMKHHADKKRAEIAFKEGEWVYIKLQPFRQLSIRLQRHSKLGRRYFGPYKKIGGVGEVAYKNTSRVSCVVT